MLTVHFGIFEWDGEKAIVNRRKHGVSFDEASTVFGDPHALDLPELRDDNRFVVIGRSSRDRILFVVHAVKHDEKVRIISARKASPSQREAYFRVVR